METFMRFKLLFIGLMALVTASCGSNATAPASTDASAIDMLSIPFGQPHPQFDGAATETAFAGSVVVSAPLVAGPLSGIFHDYYVQVDASEKRVLAATAERVFASMQECLEHHALVTSAVRSRFKVDSESSTGGGWLELQSGVLNIEVSCLLVAGANHPTLKLSIVDKPLASEVYQKARDASGR
jgi:hypothetical protein